MKRKEMFEWLMNCVKFDQEMVLGMHDYTKDGKCSSCGKCCVRFLPVSDVEIARIKKYLRFHKVVEQKRGAPGAIGSIDCTCPFRAEGEKKCLIYTCRPGICRDFRCDKPKKQILANRDEYCGKYRIVDMREEFFGK